jgi:hypothetical protein
MPRLSAAASINARSATDNLIATTLRGSLVAIFAAPGAAMESVNRAPNRPRVDLPSRYPPVGDRVPSRVPIHDQGLTHFM